MGPWRVNAPLIMAAMPGGPPGNKPVELLLSRHAGQQNERPNGRREDLPRGGLGDEGFKPGERVAPPMPDAAKRAEFERRFGGIQCFNAEKTLEAIAKAGAREP